nr:DUF1254 domain-containing protein [Massilia cavernae]
MLTAKTGSTAIFAAILLAMTGSPVFAREDASPFGKVPMEGDLPARSAIPTLFDELDFQQATQAYLWAIPLVSFAQWQKETYEKFGAKPNDLVIYTTWKDKLGILTANATTPYIIGFAELDKSGPLVVELPAGPLRAVSPTSGSDRSWRLARVDPTKALAASTWSSRPAASRRPTPGVTTLRTPRPIMC